MKKLKLKEWQPTSLRWNQQILFFYAVFIAIGSLINTLSLPQS
jgi:hypothetical protein